MVSRSFLNPNLLSLKIVDPKFPGMRNLKDLSTLKGETKFQPYIELLTPRIHSNIPNGKNSRLEKVHIKHLFNMPITTYT